MASLLSAEKGAGSEAAGRPAQVQALVSAAVLFSVVPMPTLAGVTREGEGYFWLGGAHSERPADPYCLVFHPSVR
jgi:hypothetical protein